MSKQSVFDFIKVIFQSPIPIMRTMSPPQHEVPSTVFKRHFRGQQEVVGAFAGERCFCNDATRVNEFPGLAALKDQLRFGNKAEVPFKQLSNSELSFLQVLYNKAGAEMQGHAAHQFRILGCFDGLLFVTIES